MLVSLQCEHADIIPDQQQKSRYMKKQRTVPKRYWRSQLSTNCRGFAKSRPTVWWPNGPAANGPWRSSGPTAQWPDGPAARWPSGPAACGPQWCLGPVAQSSFSIVFCPVVNPCTCTDLHWFGHAKWTTVSLNLLTIKSFESLFLCVSCCWDKQKPIAQ